MRIYLKNILIFIVLFNIKLSAQDLLQNQYNYAVQLYNNGQYFDAITEFKRLLFFDSGKRFIYEGNEYIGLSYKMGAKFSDAILYFTIAEINAGNNNQLYEVKIEIIRTNILRRTASHAIDLLNNMQNDYRFKNKSGEIQYWKGWAYIFDDKWNEAAKSFSKTDTSKALSDFCAKVDKEKYSVPFADIMSHIIPGSGQIYTGHYISGILSLGWNVLWGYLTINAFIDNRVFDGLVVGNFLWLRFYNGNLQNSVNFTENENLKINNRALDYLQSGYQGTKP